MESTAVSIAFAWQPSRVQFDITLGTRRLQRRPTACGSVVRPEGRRSFTVLVAFEKEHHGYIVAIGANRVLLDSRSIVRETDAPERAHAIPLVAPLFDEYRDRSALLSEYPSPPLDLASCARKNDVRRLRIQFLAEAAGHDFPVDVREKILQTATNNALDSGA